MTDQVSAREGIKNQDDVERTEQGHSETRCKGCYHRATCWDNDTRGGTDHFTGAAGASHRVR